MPCCDSRDDGNPQRVPPNVDNSCNPISEKKLTQGEGRYSTLKTLLGFDFDGPNKNNAAKREKLLTILEELGASGDMRYGGNTIQGV
jgi:hypothetical protein